MAKLFANSEHPDKMQHSLVHDLVLHCLPFTLPITLLGVSRLKWVNRPKWSYVKHVSVNWLECLVWLLLNYSVI